MPEIVTTLRAGLSLTLGLALAGPVSAAVEIVGVEGELLANVEAYLSIDELGCEVAARDLTQAVRDGQSDIAEALRAYGFYEPIVRSDLETGEDCWLARFTIELGPRVVLRNVDIAVLGEAEQDPSFQRALMNMNLVEGQPLNHGAYDAAKRRLSDLARDRGYAEAVYEVSRIDVYPDEGVADIALRLESGPRYRLGAVTVEQDALSEAFVRSYIDLEPGAFFSNPALTETYVALNDSGYFQTIDVRPLAPDSVAKTIDVSIMLTTAPRRLLSYGVGFSTDTGPRIRFGRNIRRFNERGHQLGFETQLSPVVSELTFNYRLPYGDPRFDWLSLSSGIKHEETETSTSDSLEFGARRITDRGGGWSTTQYLSLLVEDFEVGDQFGRSRLLMPGIDWTRLRSDDALRPSRGSRYEFEVRGGSDALGSDTDFVQLITTARWIASFGNGKRVLLRGRFGATAEDSFEALPPSVRFFAGGDNSVRGYKFESLGPVDADGEVIGGSRLAVVSAELEFPVKPRWSFALFVDSGNAFNGTDIDARTGAGVGARWQSPLGPVRFDIGVPVNDPDHDARLHISLGPDL